MDGCIKEARAVGSQMVCLVCERMDDRYAFRGVVETGNEMNFRNVPDESV